jgi:hypothetical protein
MGEGLSAVEVGRETAKHAAEGRHVHRDRALTIVEAVVLSVVTLLAAWSGDAAAKWSTESRLKLAEAAATHTKAIAHFRNH